MFALKFYLLLLWLFIKLLLRFPVIRSWNLSHLYLRFLIRWLRFFSWYVWALRKLLTWFLFLHSLILIWLVHVFFLIQIFNTILGNLIFLLFQCLFKHLLWTIWNFRVCIRLTWECIKFRVSMLDLRFIGISFRFVYFIHYVWWKQLMFIIEL
jgi:hypothetical protein